MIFSSLRKKTVCGKVKQKKRNKSPCAYFFLILLKKKYISLLFLARMWCTNHNRRKGRGEGWEGALPGSERNKTWAKKTQRQPEGCRCTGGEKNVVKMDRCDFSRRRFSTLTLSLLPFSVISRLLISRVARYTPFSQRRPDEKWKQI